MGTFIIFHIVIIGILILLWVVSRVMTKSAETTEGLSYQFTELDQEIAEKEKELASIELLKKKEKRLKELEEHIKRVSEVNEEFGITTEEVVSMSDITRKNIILTAEQIREKQKNSHWTDDKELLEEYKKKKKEILKEIEEKIVDRMVTDDNRIIYNMFYNHDMKKGSYEARMVAETDLKEEIVENLKEAGYKAELAGSIRWGSRYIDISW